MDKSPVAVMPVSFDGGDVPAYVTEGYALFQRATARAKEKGISAREALIEIASELPEPSRSWALEALGKKVN